MAQRAAIVTGASSGIGLAIAEMLGMEGYGLTVAARRPDKLEAAADGLRAQGFDVQHIAGNLGDEDTIAGVVRAHEERFGRCDVLVNNAGVGLMGAFDLNDPDKLVSMIDLNVTSLTMLTRALLPAMVKRAKGGIINVSSGFGVSVMPSFAAYIATKHYVTGLSEALVCDLAGTGVVVTQVLPGPVATEFESKVGNYTGQEAPKFVEISAERCARATIRGFDRGRAMVVPGAVITLLLMVNALSPRFMRRVFASILGKIARKKQAGAT